MIRSGSSSMRRGNGAFSIPGYQLPAKTRCFESTVRDCVLLRSASENGPEGPPPIIAFGAPAHIDALNSATGGLE